MAWLYMYMSSLMVNFLNVIWKYIPLVVLHDAGTSSHSLYATLLLLKLTSSSLHTERLNIILKLTSRTSVCHSRHTLSDCNYPLWLNSHGSPKLSHVNHKIRRFKYTVMFARSVWLYPYPRLRWKITDNRWYYCLLMPLVGIWKE
jgi:hypothetical protein